MADTVVLSTLNIKPVADAGADIEGRNPGETVMLDGSQSTDLDGDALTFEWRFEDQPEGSTATLDDNKAVRPSFTIDVKGRYEVALTVHDGQVESDRDTVQVNTVNQAPVANAGSDLTVEVGATVGLSGRMSTDADGDSLTYTWSFTDIPNGSGASLANAEFVNTTFTPDLLGTYTAQLTVSDGLEANTDTVTVSAGQPGTQTPTADAGPDQVAVLFETVFLDGSGSGDPQGDPLNYHWSLTTRPSGSTAVLTDSDTSTPFFDVDVSGDYVVQLIVDDGIHDSAPDTVTIGINVKPIADAGPDLSGHINEPISLDGTGSHDPNPEDSLNYQWSVLSQPEGAMATFSDTAIANPDFTAAVPGDYILQLVVDDDQLTADPDTTTVTLSEPELTIYTDRAAFETALDAFTREGFELTFTKAPQIDFGDFTMSNNFNVDIFSSDSETFVSEGERAIGTFKNEPFTGLTETLQFDQPLNAFGIDINAFNSGTLHVTSGGLVSEVLWKVSEDGTPPDTLFIGIVSDVSFSAVNISRSKQSDGVGYDNLVYQFAPGDP